MSEAIRIELPENPPSYEPRQELVGTLIWKRVKPFTKIEMHLFWQTDGMGDEDSEVVETLEWKDLGPEGDRFFEIRLPRAPFSLKSANLEIHWYLEAVGYPGKERATVELTIAPGARLVQLEALEKSAAGLERFKKWFGVGTRTN